MEGVGARLGRSSTRYGPATVFNGPVRKWKKRWVHVSPSSNSQNHHSSNAASHILLYKWAPAHTKDSDPPEDPPKPKFKYIPVYELEKQKKVAAEKEAVENSSDEVKPNDVEPILKNDDFAEKPDINDVPMEDSQSHDDIRVIRQDLNESTLDLSLGLTSHDGDNDNKREHARDGQLERLNRCAGT